LTKLDVPKCIEKEHLRVTLRIWKGEGVLLDVRGPWVDAYFRDAVRHEYKYKIVSYDLWEYKESIICD
jgi:hypothetical protein